MFKIEGKSQWNNRRFTDGEMLPMIWLTDFQVLAISHLDVTTSALALFQSTLLLNERTIMKNIASYSFRDKGGWVILIKLLEKGSYYRGTY
jgi:hypothetical protein